jgi:uncharacterized damage-inducible protein DinB
MISFFKDIFEYHHHFNQKLGGQIIAHQGQVGQRVLFLFSHLILAHQIWNSRILGLKPLELQQTLPLEECMNLDHDNLEKTLQILTERELTHSITYQNTHGQQFVNSIRDILFHVSNHSTHHKGQIVAELRQCGIEPVLTDYIFYKRR